jgi:hypothetical protein
MEMAEPKYLSIDVTGGLGNRLFQLATLYALARQTGRIPIIVHFEEPKHRPQDQITHYYRSFERRAEWPPGAIQICREEKNAPHIFVDWPLRFRSQIVRMQGFFQTWKYFADYEADILTLFGAPADIAAELTAKYQPANAYYLHYRHYRYVGADTSDMGFHILPGIVDYLVRAIRALPNATARILVFSDKLAETKSALAAKFGDVEHFDAHPVEYVDEDTERSLWLMTLCRGGIGSNSSFSWWAGYLNQTRDPIILPNRWYNRSRIVGLGDMIPPWVTLMPV